jgi:hypothetical protein
MSSGETISALTKARRIAPPMFPPPIITKRID